MASGDFKKNQKTHRQEMEVGTGMRRSEESWTVLTGLELLQHEVPHYVHSRIPHDPPREEDVAKNAQRGEKTSIGLS